MSEEDAILEAGIELLTRCEEVLDGWPSDTLFAEVAELFKLCIDCDTSLEEVLQDPEAHELKLLEWVVVVFAKLVDKGLLLLKIGTELVEWGDVVALVVASALRGAGLSVVMM